MFRKSCLFVLSILTFCFSTTFASESIYYPGQIVSSSMGSYKVIEELGQGALGCVYKVEDRDGTIYALKAYKTDAPEDHIFGDPVREFVNGQVLDHSHIVKSVELFSGHDFKQNETTNLILEFIEGKTLFRTTPGEFNVDQAILASADFVNAIDYAFQQGYLHLDLHGGNIMIDNQKNLRVIDLGSFCSKQEILEWFYKEFTYTTTTTESERGIKKENPKIREFFDKNPEVRDEISAKFAQQMQQRSPLDIDAILVPTYARYMMDVNNICIGIILKSNLKRDEKLDLLAETTKVVLGYQADRMEGVIEPLETYFDEFRQIIKSTEF